MADFSLADAIADDTPSQASRTAHINPSAPSAPVAPSWPGAAPGGPNFPPAGGPVPPAPVPGAPGQFPSMPAGPGGYPPGPGMPGQFPPAPGQFPPAPGQFPGMPYPDGHAFPSPPGAPQAPQAPYPNMPYPGMYGPGGPAPAPAPAPGPFQPGGGFHGGAFPPVPPGSWGFGPGPTGPYGGHPAPHPAPGGMLPVPYDLPLHAGIMPRLLITVVGEPIPGGDRFQVDFMKGPDVVFHFNPRFHEQTIVRNSNLGGFWGPEEREGGFPFIQGRQFELKILVEEDVYKVAIDGIHLLEYEHRVGGMEQVTLVRVLGDVTLHSIAPSMI